MTEDLDIYCTAKELIKQRGLKAHQFMRLVGLQRWRASIWIDLLDWTVVTGDIGS